MNHHNLELLSWGLFFFFLKNKQTVQSLNKSPALSLVRILSIGAAFVLNEAAAAVQSLHAATGKTKTKH